MRTGNGSPVGVINPAGPGDEYYDFAGHQKWIANGASFASWEQSSGEAAVAPSVLPLASGVALTLLTVPIAAGKQAAGILDFFIRCSDGTDFQPVMGHVKWVAANKAGTITTDVTPLVTLPNANTKAGGTIAVNVALVASGAAVLIQLTVTPSITPPAGSLNVTVSSRNF